jgi:cytochrome P450
LPAAAGPSRRVGAVTDRVDGVDIFTDENVINDPYPYFDALRSRCPVHPIAEPRVLAVTGYDEAVEIYRNDAVFSSCNAMGGPFPPFPVEPGTDDITELVQNNREYWVFNEFMVTRCFALRAQVGPRLSAITAVDEAHDLAKES